MSNVGFRVYKRINRPAKALLEQFKGLPVANIADEMNRLGCMDARIRPLNSSPVVGPALTVKARTGDNLMLHRAIDMAEPGDVIVVEDQGDLAHALIGELMMLWAQRRGVAGVIVDGAMRDLDVLRELKIAAYAAGIQPKGPYKGGPGEINTPISCGGVVVNPGDVVVGDADGVLVINPADAPGVLDKAKGKYKKEMAAREAIAGGTWDRSAYSEEALRAMGCEFIDDVWK
jgi:regulator of RNase E activity RraA